MAKYRLCAVYIYFFIRNNWLSKYMIIPYSLNNRFHIRLVFSQTRNLLDYYTPGSFLFWWTLKIDLRSLVSQLWTYDIKLVVIPNKSIVKLQVLIITCLRRLSRNASKHDGSFTSVTSSIPSWQCTSPDSHHTSQWLPARCKSTERVSYREKSLWSSTGSPGVIQRL